VLKVKHILVTGHYGCGGVQAALGNGEMGLIDNWLRHIKDIYTKYEADFEGLDNAERVNRLCEINVAEQVANVCHTTIVQSAWKQGQQLSVHGLIYGLGDGILHDLGINISSMDDLAPIYRMLRKAEMPPRR
jgi:carbonic anhydrase